MFLLAEPYRIGVVEQFFQVETDFSAHFVRFQINYMLEAEDDADEEFFNDFSDPFVVETGDPFVVGADPFEIDYGDPFVVSDE